MYTYVSALVLPDQPTPQWESADVASMLVSTLYRSYRDVVLTLTPPGAVDDEVVYVSMNSLRAQYATYNNTVTVLLQVLGNQTLQTLDELPTANLGYVKYSDMVQSGYVMELAKRGSVFPETYPRSELTDLLITRPGMDTDLALIHTHGLVSVNGYYHLTDSDGIKTWIVDGGLSIRASNQHHCGLTSFLSVGSLQKVTFTDEQITPAEGNTTLSQVIKLESSQSLEGKSFFLVLGGYLVFPDGERFYRTGEHAMHLHLKRLPYVERLIESRSGIDLHPLGITVSELSPHLYNLEELWSDTVIRKYLQLSQSFLVIVDTPSLFVNTLPLRQFNTPGVFSTIPKPTLPLQVGFGRTAEYWRVHEDGHWAVTVQDSFARNYLFSRHRQAEMVNINDALSFDRPFYMSQGHLLEIGTYGA